MANLAMPRRFELEFWRARSRGLSDKDAATAAGVSQATAFTWVHQHGGVKPDTSTPSGRFLSLEERIEIHAGFTAGCSDQEIALRLGRSRSTIWRERTRNCVVASGRRRPWRGHYRPVQAQSLADKRGKRRKPRKIEKSERLRVTVQRLLDDDLSPEQVSGRLRVLFPNDEGMRISHETIYQCIYTHGSGSLTRELTATLRTGRAVRKPKRLPTQRRGAIANMVNIVERPDEANGRVVPGHWEGDLILGSSNRSAVANLGRTHDQVLPPVVSTRRSHRRRSGSRDDHSDPRDARTVTKECYLGPRKRNGTPRCDHTSNRDADLLLRSPQSVAAPN